MQHVEMLPLGCPVRTGLPCPAVPEAGPKANGFSLAKTGPLLGLVVTVLLALATCAVNNEAAQNREIAALQESNGNVVTEFRSFRAEYRQDYRGLLERMDRIGGR